MKRVARWTHIFRVLAALMASSIAWNFAQALGFPTFVAFHSHSQVGMAIGAALLVLFTAYANDFAKVEG